MNSSHWFPWPKLFFLFIRIYCPIVAGRLHSAKFPTPSTGSCSWHQTSWDWFSQRQGGTCLFLAFCALRWAPQDKVCVDVSFQTLGPGSLHTPHPKLMQPLGKAPLSAPSIMSFLLYMQPGLSGTPSSVGMGLARKGKYGQLCCDSGTSLSPPTSGRRGLSLIRKQNHVLPCPACFPYARPLNYLLIIIIFKKGFIPLGYPPPSG